MVQGELESMREVEYHGDEINYGQGIRGENESTEDERER
jgi:hypothetical protein